MNTTPQKVANYFLDKASNEGIDVSPMKLVKLVYIAYGWYIALTGERLFDEKIQAWKHGPVVSSIYHEFKKFGSSAINCRSYELDMKSLKVVVPRINEDKEDMLLILSKVWAAYRSFTGWHLSEKTHEDGSPWHKVYNAEKRDTILKDDDIKAHYTEKLETYLGYDKKE